MLLISRHLIEYNIVPAGAVVRINLAWTPPDHLRELLRELSHTIFLDVPTGRTKPPVVEWKQSEVVKFAKRYPGVKYVGVSNVSEPADLMYFLTKLPRRVTVVPKIESVWACQNIRQIEQVLPVPKIIMLDHDDLFHDMIHKGELPLDLYKKYVDPLVDFCRRNEIRLLRTAGVVFSDR